MYYTEILSILLKISGWGFLLLINLAKEDFSLTTTLQRLDRLGPR